MAPQGSRPHRQQAPDRRRGDPGDGGYAWRDDDDSEDYPPWAGLGVTPRWADQQERDRRKGQPGAGGPPADPGTGGHRAQPGFRSAIAVARARRNRLMLYIWGAAVVAVAVIAVIVVEFHGHAAPKQSAPGLITTYQPGELKTVPNACSSLSAATLSQYLPGQRAVLAPKSLDGASQSMCDWTVDAPPVYRHLSVAEQGYAPSGLATGDGSATAAATDAYQAAMAQKVKPPKSSGLPKATVSPVPHLGAQAFTALQVVRAGGDVTDVETVVVRVHNVLVTITLQGLDRSHTHRYGPVSAAALQAGAIAMARAATAKL